MWEELQWWESCLAADVAGPFLSGADFSLADVAVFPLIAFAVRCKRDLGSKAPHLAQWYGLVAERPSVQASWPPHRRESSGNDLGLNET